MPVQACSLEGRPGYKYGVQGKCYTYAPGDEASRKRAKQKAYIQGAAIESHTGEDNLKKTAVIIAQLKDGIAGYSTDGQRIYIDPDVPDYMIDPILVHEFTEMPLVLIQGMPYEEADALATEAEHYACDELGINWETYDAEFHRLMQNRDSTVLDPEDIHEGSKDAYKPNVEEAGQMEKGIDVGDVSVPGPSWRGKKRKDMTKEELAECEKERAACPKLKKSVDLFKMDDEQHLVYGVVLVPDVEDLQGDVCSKEAIQEAAHDYLVNSRLIKAQHRAPTDADVVQCYIAPVDIPIGKGIAPAGSWILVTKINSGAMWAAIKKGDITGYSIGGIGTREEM